MSRNIFITGVSSGIGHALVSRYLNDGHLVWGVSRRRPEDLIGQPGFHFEQLDLTDESNVRQLIPGMFGEVTELDLVILNAGILGEIADMADVTLDQLRTLMDVNVWANKTLLDSLFSAGIHLQQVVAISSGAAVNGNRGWNGYSISKAALNMLVQLYSREHAETHFTALAPGLVDTAMQEFLRGRPEDARFPSLQRLKSCWNTDEMPSPTEAARRLAAEITKLPVTVRSGEFADIRELRQ